MEWELIVLFVMLVLMVLVIGMGVLGFVAFVLNSNRLDANLKKVQAAAKNGPFFYQTIKGSTMVLVRRDDYEHALAQHERAVVSGEKERHDEIVLVILPSFTFYKDAATRRNFTEVGTWEDVRALKLEAVRLVSGFDKGSFGEVLEKFPTEVEALVASTTCNSTQVFIPFSSEGMMSFQKQELLFGQQSLTSARDVLLTEVIVPAA